MNETGREEQAASPRCDELCQASKEETKIRKIGIRQLEYGYVVEVGCHWFAIETVDKLLQALTDYVNNPKSIEKAWFDGKFLK